MDENKKDETEHIQQTHEIYFVFVYFSGICHRAVLLGDVCILSEYSAKYN